MRSCTRCERMFPETLEYFSAGKKYTGGLRPQCRECEKAYRREYRAKHVERDQATQKAWKDANREHVNANRRAKHAKQAEHINQLKRTWYANNAERERERSREWYSANAEQCRELTRRSHAKNAAKNNAKMAEYRANHKDYFRQKSLERYWANPVESRLKSKLSARQNADKLKEYRKAHREDVRIRKQRRRARQRQLPDTFTTDDWQFALDYFHNCCAVCGRQLKDLFKSHTAAMDHWIPLTSPDCPGTISGNIVPLCQGVNGCNNSKGSAEPEVWLLSRFGERIGRKKLDSINVFLNEALAFSEQRKAA